jgi:hypothetical protein
LYAVVTGTIGAAEHLRTSFNPMPDDTAATVRARWSQLMDCAFKAVEHVRLPLSEDLKALVVIVPAYFALGHKIPRLIGSATAMP